MLINLEQKEKRRFMLFFQLFVRPSLLLPYIQLSCAAFSEMRHSNRNTWDEGTRERSFTSICVQGLGSQPAHAAILYENHPVTGAIGSHKSIYVNTRVWCTILLVIHTYLYFHNYFTYIILEWQYSWLFYHQYQSLQSTNVTLFDSYCLIDVGSLYCHFCFTCIGASFM